MKRFCISVLFFAFAIMQSCTDFQESEAPVSFGVNTKELAFSKDGGISSLTVSSGSKWDVTSMPEWISLGGISSSGLSPYEWTVSISASANDGYNRDGVIVLKANTETIAVSLTQEGGKGKYVAVESISISSTELTLTVGENASLSYTITPSDASIKNVTWESSSPSIATISQSGRVDAIAEGKTVITVTTEDGGKTASCVVTVKPVRVSSVTLDKKTLTLKVGESSTLTATVLPENAANKNVSWSSSNTNVATVSKGKVTAKAAGTATITVKTDDGGKTASCTVTVIVPVTGVSLDQKSLSLAQGSTATLKATITPSNATNKDVTWSSSDDKVVTVSNGKVTAKAAGTAIVTVTTKDGGKTDSCSVSVYNIASGDIEGTGEEVWE